MLEHNSVRPERAIELARNAGLPSGEIALMYYAASMSRQERALAMCQLAATVGRLCVRGAIEYKDACALLTRVIKTIEDSSVDVFLTWYRTRGDSDFAMARDFICFQRAFETQTKSGVAVIMEGFRSAVAAKLEKPDFDIFQDELSGASRVALSTELISFQRPALRTGLN